MFTGLVESVQKVRSVTTTAGGRRLGIALGPLAVDAKAGDSICVSGVCLTIAELEGRSGTGWFDVMGETLRSSTLERIKAGDAVNREGARAGAGRFGGHIGQGHVDGVGTIERIEAGRSQYVIWVGAEPGLMRYVIGKGSIAIDGISLTVVGVEKGRFSVWLIPTTLRETTLREKKAGEKVNLEADLISKWIRTRLDEVLGKGGGGELTMAALREQGFR